MMLDVKTVFETSRLMACEWNSEFAPAAFEIYSDTKVTEFISGTFVESTRQMKERIESIIQRNRDYPEGMGSFPIFLKSTGTMVGTALIKPLPLVSGQLADEIEIGWHLARRQWGRGYATEYGQKLIEVGFNDFGLDELHAVVDPPNVKSIKVAERLGMKHLGQSTKYYEGNPVEHFLMTREMFESSK